MCDTHHDSLITLNEYTLLSQSVTGGRPQDVADAFAKLDLDGNGPLDPEGIRPDVIELFTSDGPDARGTVRAAVSHPPWHAASGRHCHGNACTGASRPEGKAQAHLFRHAGGLRL
ncbi:hypothetical protein ACIQWL_46310 [Streptomyces mirabilis]|uniref:hypothetical protein n=1 Tax=Streptomyces mirabilis TaxID=68239 RepID=UPI000765EB22